MGGRAEARRAWEGVGGRRRRKRLGVKGLVFAEDALEGGAGEPYEITAGVEVKGDSGG